MIGPLLVFDFDQTIADLNTDVEVHRGWLRTNTGGDIKLWKLKQCI